MLNFIECKVEYITINERNGKQKKVSEIYLVDAMSFIEAITIVTEKMQEITADFKMLNVKIPNYTEVIPFIEGSAWFKCKVISEDEEEKKTTENILIWADNGGEAYDRCFDYLSGFISQFTIDDVVKTQIIEVIGLKTEGNENIYRV